MGPFIKDVINRGGGVVKNSQNLVNVVYECPLRGLYTTPKRIICKHLGIVLCFKPLRIIHQAALMMPCSQSYEMHHI